ncbi:MAG: HAMP domain-containing histidine kinase [Chloroflexi bacterium]|nr:HAMP domain-containing histidine kinase [Chloroflexota bacterium]
MSLRARLTLFYTVVLGAVLVLFGLAVYGLVSVVQLRQVDATLERTARDLILVTRINDEGDFVLSERVSLDSSVIVQIWDTNNRLVGLTPSAEPDSPLRQPLDSTNFSATLPVYNSVTVGGVHFRVLTVPLYTQGTPIGVLQSGTSLTILDALRDEIVRYLVVLSLIAVILAGMFGLVSGRRALSPLAAATDTALQITRADDLSKRIPTRGIVDDEVGKLITAFNDTMGRLEKLFATQRRFVADIGHELRTPLTVIRGNIDLMRRVGIEDEQSLHSIELEVDRLSRLVEDLLILAQAESGKLPMDRRRVELDTLLLEVFSQAHILAGEQVRLEIGQIDQVLVCGDRDRLKQVVLNLVANAIKYTTEGGKVTVSLSKETGQGVFSVKDTGMGIPSGDLPHVFERFYRGDKSRSRSKDGAGFGLGLSIAYWIVRNHGGEIEVKSKLNRGSTFTVRLPLADKDCADATGELSERKPLAAQPERIG